MKAKRGRKKQKSEPKLQIITSSVTPRTAKNTILVVIVIVMLAILAYTIFTLIATPEYLVKREIESITADYYENYFYENNILKSNSLSLDDVKDATSAKEHLESILDNYLETGFSRITLNQLLLSNNRKYYSSASSISKYCDLNATFIKIFPLSPYTKKDYRVDYKYSCNF